MRIGYLIQQGAEIRHPPFNGPANHVREVTAALGRAGHRVRVLVGLDRRIWRSDDLEVFEPITAKWLDHGPLRLAERGIRRLQSELRLPYAALFESIRFSQACVQELQGVDLLYERTSWVGYGGALAARRLNVPLILEDNGDALFDLESKGIAPQGWQRRLSLALMRRTVAQATHVVSSGAGWREQFIQRWQFAADRITTIENGTALVSMLDRGQLRSFSGAADVAEPVTLVYLGGFYPWHGVPALLEALSRARQRGVNARLLMIGSGDGFAAAQELVGRLDLHDHVTMAGQRTPAEYAPMLASADIGLSPYCGWPEFSGLKVLDYKAAGLPTIGSGRDGHPPTLAHERTGLIVPPCEVEALAQAIMRLCSDRTLRRRMGQAARIEAEALHGWEQTVTRLERLLVDLLQEARAA
jgi:glycosyltransferase involved in cell wall biosynthesis